MITPSFSLTATERVLPKLALDFTTASLDPRVTFTRTGNTATVTNSSGFIEPINADLPRFDFDPVNLTCKGLLIEEARTNLTFPSNDFSGFTFTNISYAADNATSPSGLVDADRLSVTSSSGVARAATITKAASALTYTTSIYMKTLAYTGNFTLLVDGGTGANAGSIVFNLSTGSFISALNEGTFTNTSGTVTNVGDGWYRITCTTTTGTTTSLRVYWVSGPTPCVYWVYGIQVEQAAFATSYIPTTTASVLRNADVATMTGTNFSDWYNATEGSFVAELSQNGLALGTDAQVAIAVDDNTTNNRNWIYARANLNLGTYIVSSGGSTVANIPSLNAVTINTVYRHAISYKANKFVYSLNAVQNGVDTAGAVPVAPTQMYIGSRSSNTFYLNGHMMQILYYPQSLTNAELLAFSK